MNTFEKLNELKVACVHPAPDDEREVLRERWVGGWVG